MFQNTTRSWGGMDLMGTVIAIFFFCVCFFQKKSIFKCSHLRSGQLINHLAPFTILVPSSTISVGGLLKNKIAQIYS